MARITCRIPSSARPLLLRYQGVTNSWFTLAEAPDFSVPDSSGQFPVRDPADASRAIRPGEVFLMTPLTVRSLASQTFFFEVRIVTEDASVLLMHRVVVPFQDSVQLAVQGLALTKRQPESLHGDQLQIRAESSGLFDVVGGAHERPASEHVGVV